MGKLMADESAQKKNWWQKLNPLQQFSVVTVGTWFLTQSATYAFKVFADNLIKSPELAGAMSWLLGLLADRLVLGIVLTLAIIGFAGPLWRLWQSLDIQFVQTDDKYRRAIIPNPITFRIIRLPGVQGWQYEVALWADFENVGEDVLGVQVIGWRAEIMGRAPDYTQPLLFASSLMAGEAQFLRFPRIPIPEIGPHVTGFVEFAILFGYEGFRPRHGLYCKYQFEFEEYDREIVVGAVRQIDSVPQDRVELIYGSPKKIRQVMTEKALLRPGVSIETAPEAIPAAEAKA